MLIFIIIFCLILFPTLLFFFIKSHNKIVWIPFIISFIIQIPTAYIAVNDYQIAEHGNLFSNNTVNTLLVISYTILIFGVGFNLFTKPKKK